MTQDRTRKKEIRARMAASGEPYSVAARNLADAGGAGEEPLTGEAAEIAACAVRTLGERSARMGYRTDWTLPRLADMGLAVRLAGTAVKAVWKWSMPDVSPAHFAYEGFAEPAAGRYMFSGSGMADQALPGGVYRTGDLDLARVGYGAMQLAGPGVFGPPEDRAAAIAVLREAVDCGVNHIDTADFYGPQVTNEIIREALAPYPDDLHIVTKVGARRDADGGWPHARTPAELRQQVHDNLSHLGLDILDVVNLRVGGVEAPEPGSISAQFEALAELQQQGLIRHLGLSTVTADQLAEAQSIAPVVCVQNLYNIARPQDDALVDLTARQGIAYVPYFPLGGFTPLQSGALHAVAARLGATPMSIALAWLLQRSPNIMLIPGTSSVTHLRENIASAGLKLPPEAVAALDAIGGAH